MVLKTRKVKMVEYTYRGEKLVGTRVVMKEQCYLTETVGKRIWNTIWKSKLHFLAMAVFFYGVYVGTHQEMPMLLYYIFGLGFMTTIMLVAANFLYEFGKP